MKTKIHIIGRVYLKIDNKAYLLGRTSFLKGIEDMDSRSTKKTREIDSIIEDRIEIIYIANSQMMDDLKSIDSIYDGQGKRVRLLKKDILEEYNIGDKINGNIIIENTSIDKDDIKNIYREYKIIDGIKRENRFNILKSEYKNYYID